MSNFKITLNEALQLKETIQDKLTRYQFILKNENSVPAGRKRNYDLKKLVKDEEDLRQNMVTLKLLIQAANLFVASEETQSISYYVFLMSERKRQIDNLKVMPTDEGPLVLSAGTLDKNAVKNITVKYTCIFNNKDKEEMITKLNKEYREISNKLTKLNGETTINLPFDPSKI
jgi:hypothetical protein